MPYTQLLQNLYAAFFDNSIECKPNAPLAKHSTFCIGGPASLAVWPNSRLQLIRVLDLWRKLGDSCPICVIGNGSNVLFPDYGYHGLVVVTKNANRIVFEEDEAPDRDEFRREHIYCQVYAECGASLTELANACASPDRALSGLEFAYGIPGTVGSATVTNAGAYGSDMERVLCKYRRSLPYATALRGGYSWRIKSYGTPNGNSILAKVCQEQRQGKYRTLKPILHIAYYRRR